jgi:methyl acetate hydrolase
MSRCFRAVLVLATSVAGVDAAFAGSPISHLRPELIDAALRSAVVRGSVGGVVAMVANQERILYRSAFGRRDVRAGLPMTEDTLFRLFSMTKPVTSVAAMQLIEQGRLQLDDPVEKYLPEMGRAMVLENAGTREESLRPPKSPVLVRHLLTHTSGLAYPYWSKELRLYQEAHKNAKGPPILVFDPGTQWLYGTSTDTLGRLVETISGVTLDEYFRVHIFQPLGMRSTYFNVPASEFDRLASLHTRESNGRRREEERKPPTPVSSFSGGGGLYGTAGDYAAFMRMILNHGAAGDRRILKPETVRLMTQNQIGRLAAGRLSTAMPELSNDVDFHPGFADRFGFGFLINEVGYKGGRARGSLAWAGAANTYFWIDPESGICAVLLMQVLPFFDGPAVELLRAFEHAVYTSVTARLPSGGNRK